LQKETMMPIFIRPVVAVSLCAAAALFAVAGFAASDKPAPDDQDTIVIKVIKTRGATEGAPTPPAPPGEPIVSVTSCDRGARAVDTASETKSDDGTITKSRVILCNKGSQTPQDVAQRLTKARQKIVKGNELDGALKAKVLAALDQQIAQAKTR
jgi:hypothetical protein